LDTSTKRLRRVLAKALDAATPTLREIARSARITYYAIRQYRRGERAPSGDVVRRLVAALRAHAQRVLRNAEDLEREADRNP